MTRGTGGSDRAGPAPRGSRCLGLDEAGRGSVLGPLVIGGFLCDEAVMARLPSLGARDSKELSPRRRAEVERALGAVGRRLTVVLPPARVDEAVRHHRLNRLEAEAFAQLLRETRPERVFLDSCEVNTDRFGREVAERAGFVGAVEARNHADRDLPIVGAASIVAKVRRDAAIARIAGRIGRPVGSGYPSDPVTRAYLAATLRPGVPGPEWVRHSWKTTATVMAERTRTTLDRFPP